MANSQNLSGPKIQKYTGQQTKEEHERIDDNIRYNPI